MTKKLLLTTLILAGLTNTAHAMDDAERARQMEVFKAYQQTGAGMVTKTTTTAPMAATTTITTNAAPIVVTAPASTSAAQTTTTTIRTKMRPLNDDGTPMASPPAAAMASTVTDSDERAREMAAYKAYQSGQTTTTTTTSTTTATSVPAAAMPQPVEPALTNQTSVTTDMAPVEDLAAPAIQIVTDPITAPAMPTQSSMSTTSTTTITREAKPTTGAPAMPETLAPATTSALQNQKADGDFYATTTVMPTVTTTTEGGVHIQDAGQLGR